jgi:hypothetical protein
MARREIVRRIKVLEALALKFIIKERKKWLLKFTIL